MVTVLVSYQLTSTTTWAIQKVIMSEILLESLSTLHLRGFSTVMTSTS